MTAQGLADLLATVGIRVRSWNIDEDPGIQGRPGDVDRFSVRLDEDDSDDLLLMHRLVGALLSAGCVSCRVRREECGSGDEVSEWKELEMEFPVGDADAEA